MAKDPAFLFYSSDFISGTFVFSNHQKGQYIILLAVMHQQGRLTLDEINIVLREPVDTAVLKKFNQDEEGKFYNDRLEEECIKRKKFTESRRNSLKIDNGDMVNLYLLFDPVTNNYKIGSSKFPELRLQEAKKSNSEIISYWISPVLVERVNEKMLHDKYRAKKARYDWFSLSDEDLENIKETFRTNVEKTFRTENENENRNENVIEKEKGVVGEKTFSKYPSEKDLEMSLPQIKNGAVQELFAFSKGIRLTSDQVGTLWEIFKKQNFTGEKFYNSDKEIFSHFINWSKTQHIDLKTLDAAKAQNKPKLARQDQVEALYSKYIEGLKLEAYVWDAEAFCNLFIKVGLFKPPEGAYDYKKTVYDAFRIAKGNGLKTLFTK